MKTNEDYARHLCCSGCNNYVCYTNKKQCQTLNDLLTMAQWKDEQHKQERQQLIYNAAEWFRNRFPNMSNESIEKFKEDMKGE